ncbi:TRAP transporter substrate-binding protein [Paracraurococcus lichenis]|uniref:TRAP transporter substrate-binding protein n=1 Tax=Paracraurococcus lichenis TaxID=3064888 RepID=A0ABT9E7W2_9PROT|nr:TRAP transporter substrate-binding protein [Paracraurococcus sp. LOR1-02]MDO9712043.1 TRAP transporter substrate-binding protein [Paracraurococcus sp. LOR1-02]
MFRLVAAAVLAACFALPAAAQTRWVMATPYAETNFHTRNVRAFLQDIEQATGGKLAVQAHHNGTLLPMPQIKRGVQTGQVQLGEILLSVYGNEDPFFEVDSVPFLADTWPASDALHRATEPFIRARFERQGLTLLYMVHWNSQGFYTRAPLTSLEELRGTRLRAFNNLTFRFAELLGAQPVTVQVPEIPQAFATNLVNVLFTSAQTGVDASAWDFARHFTDVGGMRPRNAIFANTRALAALDPALRQAVLDAAARAEARGREMSRAAENEMLEKLRSQGMQVAEAPPAMQAALREVGAKQTQEWLQRAGPDGGQMLERYRALLPR